MEWFREINLFSIILRLVLAIVIGGFLGMERGLKNRPAGMRTYILVCVGSALVMMTNQYVYQNWHVSDPVRMGAQVVSGIGFLGAGAIIITGKSQVRGITTAAGIWASACCGLAVGIGFYEGALFAGFISLLVMGALEKFDLRIRARACCMDIFMEFDAKTRFSDFVAYAKEHGITLSGLQMQKSQKGEDPFLNILFTAELSRHCHHEEILSTLYAAPGVHYIEELQ